MEPKTNEARIRYTPGLVESDVAHLRTWIIRLDREITYLRRKVFLLWIAVLICFTAIALATAHGWLPEIRRVLGLF